ncbi:sugar phosphate nucleotidyltransferase [Bacillus gaemokensis]|uniref:Nucleotidyltransferase n=1 Tax=Bacillus gaemokensis TaxID=574375 RepID=A0A073KFZ7_9BACI|nr:sugar phosphate nucleotidyltransferase [Bacillus gaemokensis]KEK26199.1 nucleotidyltransferase [Bacillus gaemokensis]KYG39005.1 nucleotidyltransferase [Bacillus gaemokensis]
MKGVILAGGKGRRLRPLTCSLPKPMLRLLEKPVLEYNIELLRQHGIYDIAITVQYMSTAIRQYFGDGSKWGVKLHYFEDSPPLGTAGSIKQAETFLDEPFVVISGDALTDFQLSEGIEFHQCKKRLVTMFVKEVENPLSFGLVTMNKEQEIVRYMEKPSWNEVISNIVNTGIYIMDPEIFSYIPSGQFVDFSHHVFPLLENKNMLFGYKEEGYWLDIGTFDQYRQAQFDLLTKKVKVQLPYTEVLPMVWMGEGVTIEKGTKIHGPSFIGSGAIIGSGTIIEPYSIIGKYSMIENYTHLQKSIVLAHTHIGKRCELLETTIGENTIIEDDVTLFQNSVVADHCQIGKNTVIKQNGKLWPYKVIDSHSIVASSGVMERENTSGWLQKSRIVGRSNIEITPQVIVKVAMAYGSLFQKGERVLVGSYEDVEANAFKKLFLHTIHGVGLHTVECQKMNESAFQYAINEMECAGGVFFRLEREQGLVIQLYGEQGKRLTYKQQKEIENVYMSEAFHYVYDKEIGRNEMVHVCLENYVEAVLEHLDVTKIQKQQFHLLINKRDEMFQPILMSFLQKLGCTVTWIYAGEQKEHVKLLMKSSRANMALMFYEQGNKFELYDNHGGIYHNTNFEEIDVPDLLLGSVENRYPISLKLGECYLLFYMNDEKNKFQIRWKRDILYRIGKLFELIANQGKTLSAMLEQSPPLYLLCDEVVCSWKEKGKVMGMLLQDRETREVEVLEGVQFKYTEKEWSYIVSDAKHPKFLVYSHARNPVIAKENMKNLIEKIRQYQKV